ncbi:MAG TPA: hypothetical protein VJZ06_07095, partial [Mobilitalea sp.]|nr:hypothetical protein [Mobilitalea sp.]
MGKLTIKQKIFILLFAIFIGIAGLCISIVLVNERNTDPNMYNRARVLLNDSIHKANNLVFSGLEKYTYSI